MYSGGDYAAVRGVGHMEWSMGMQTFARTTSDGGTGESSLPDKEAICVEEGQLVV